MSKRVFLLFVFVQLKWECYLGISSGAGGVVKGADETTLVSGSMTHFMKYAERVIKNVSSKAAL